MSSHTQNEKLVEAIKGKAIDDKLACGAVFAVIGEIGARPIDAGKTLDLLEISITKCQLGLFGYQPEKKIVKPAESVSDEMKNEINARLNGGKLSCASAWEIAKKLKVAKMDVAAACDTLKIKIIACQIGAF